MALSFCFLQQAERFSAWEAMYKQCGEGEVTQHILTSQFVQTCIQAGKIEYMIYISSVLLDTMNSFFVGNKI